MDVLGANTKAEENPPAQGDHVCADHFDRLGLVIDPPWSLKVERGRPKISRPHPAETRINIC